jgi:hypothetical protein
VDCLIYLKVQDVVLFSGSVATSEKYDYIAENVSRGECRFFVGKMSWRTYSCKKEQVLDDGISKVVWGQEVDAAGSGSHPVAACRVSRV